MHGNGRSRRWLLGLALVGVGGESAIAAEAPSRFDAVLDKLIANERELADRLERYEPLVETYLQTMEPHAERGFVPVNDTYFLGRLRLSGDQATTSDLGGEATTAKKRAKRRKSLELFDDYHSQTFKPEAFARMLTVDRGAFDRDNYLFDFVRTEFLGEVRTLVLDVTPREGKALKRLGSGRFTGRIWIEDKEFQIVRFNGIYASLLGVPFHFDSWRMNLASGEWLPAYVYTEESDRPYKQIKRIHKGQTRLWGYRLAKFDAEDEFTKVLVDIPRSADDVDSPGRISPVESSRAWEAEAEDNVIRRLERSGLLAPSGPVDRILETVVSNLEITNNLSIEPAVRCRVLLTTPLESFTIGHTIVVSRGLIDVLPNEASLALVLAHELGHITSGHDLDTRFAFSDILVGGDRTTLRQFPFERGVEDELEADESAAALLEKSPYKDGLGSAGLFLRALSADAPNLPSLIRPHFGNRLADEGGAGRMAQLMATAPPLDPTSLEQIAALPLGGRVRVDPWSAQIELMKDRRIALLSAREKMPFQVTPLMPYLTRLDASPGAAVREQSDENP